jgi:ParB family chromosome partitioning protein
MAKQKTFDKITAASFHVPAAATNSALVDAVVQDSTREHADIPFSLLLPNPKQPRKAYDQEKLKELAASIRELGLLEEIVVRRSLTQDGCFETIAGERRVRACRDELGWSHIPATIRVCTDVEMLEIAIIENDQRQDLTPLELAQSYKDLYDMREGGERIFSIRTLAERLGKNRDTVHAYISMLDAPDDVLQLMRDDPQTPIRIINELADVLEVADRRHLIDGVRSRRWKTDDIIAIVRQMKREQTKPSAGANGTSHDGDTSHSDEALTEHAATAPQPSPALRRAELLRILTKDSDAIARIVKRIRTDDTLVDEELEVVRQHARAWIENIEQLLS